MKDHEGRYLETHTRLVREGVKHLDEKNKGEVTGTQLTRL